MPRRGASVRIIQHGAKANPDAFFATGARAMLIYLRELSDHGVDPRNVGSVLDFGIGFGRLIRHWLPIGPALFGTDVTEEAVAFCREHRAIAWTSTRMGVNPNFLMKEASLA